MKTRFVTYEGWENLKTLPEEDLVGLSQSGPQKKEKTGTSFGCVNVIVGEKLPKGRILFCPDLLFPVDVIYDNLLLKECLERETRNGRVIALDCTPCTPG